MKALHRIWRIPKPVRACFWVVVTLIVAITYYIVLGCPTLTMRQEFRRAEKLHMVGPSKIVDTITEYYDFKKMMVGETEHGIIFLGKSGSTIQGGKHSGQMHYVFNYQEKTDDVTVAVAPSIFGSHYSLPGINLPIYVFTEYPEAERAEIHILVTGEKTANVNGVQEIEAFSHEFQGDARRDSNGFFRFFLDIQDENSGRALYALSVLVSGYDFMHTVYDTVSIPVTVRLYDANDQLILTKEMNLAPPAAE